MIRIRSSAILVVTSCVWALPAFALECDPTPLKQICTYETSPICRTYRAYPEKFHVRDSSDVFEFAAKNWETIRKAAYVYGIPPQAILTAMVGADGAKTQGKVKGWFNAVNYAEADARYMITGPAGISAHRAYAAERLAARLEHLAGLRKNATPLDSELVARKAETAEGSIFYAAAAIRFRTHAFGRLPTPPGDRDFYNLLNQPETLATAYMLTRVDAEVEGLKNRNRDAGADPAKWTRPRISGYGWHARCYFSEIQNFIAQRPEATGRDAFIADRKSNPKAPAEIHGAGSAQTNSDGKKGD